MEMQHRLSHYADVADFPDANGHLAGSRALECLHMMYGKLNAVELTAGVLEEGITVDRRCRLATLAPIDELYPDNLFQFGDTPTQRLLGYTQHFRCLGETSALDDRHETLEFLVADIEG